MSSFSCEEREEGLMSGCRTDHFYSAANWLLTKDTGLLVGQYKNFYVGELDWTGTVRPLSFLSIRAR